MASPGGHRVLAQPEAGHGRDAGNMWQVPPMRLGNLLLLSTSAAPPSREESFTLLFAVGTQVQTLVSVWIILTYS